MASECSSKFAKIIGKGNPVAVLATMILLSYSKFSNVILASFSLLHGKPAQGSRILDVTKLGNIVKPILKSTRFKAVSFFSHKFSLDLMVIIFCCRRLNTPKRSDCKEGLQELAIRCHGNCYLL